MARGKILFGYVIAIVAVMAAFALPWHHVSGDEWDDGEHVWGRNVHSNSLFVYDLGTEVPEDETGIQLRQAGFWAVSGGLALGTIAFLFAAADRRAWAISLGWVSFLALTGGAAATVLGILKEIPESQFAVGAGLIAMGIAVVDLLVANFMAIGLGKTRASVRRREAKWERKQARREERMEARAARKAQAS